jgi:hypothetical protein
VGSENDGILFYGALRMQSHDRNSGSGVPSVALELISE